MILDFNRMPTQTRKNFRGGDLDTIVRMYQDKDNTIMFMKLEPGASIGYHKHDDGSEIIYILQGVASAVYDEVEEILEPGMCGYCPKGHSHGMANKGEEDLVFFSVVSKVSEGASESEENTSVEDSDEDVWEKEIDFLTQIERTKEE